MLNKISLGTVQFGLDYGIANKRGRISDKEIFGILDFAHSKGIKSLDTGYAYGKSENLIGRYMEDGKNSFKIISKLPAQEKYSSENVEKLFFSSLKRLNKKKIYGYLLHRFEDFLSHEELWDIFRKLKKSGLVKKIGFSLYRPEELEILFDRKVDFDIVQIPYNIFDQRFKIYSEALKKRQVEVYARSVFLQGLFFLKMEEIEKRFSSATGPMKKLNMISCDSNIPVHSLCLCFVLLSKFIDNAIVGIDSLAQLKQNLDSLKYMGVAKKNFDLIERTLMFHDEKVILPFNWQ